MKMNKKLMAAGAAISIIAALASCSSNTSASVGAASSAAQGTQNSGAGTTQNNANPSVVLPVDTNPIVNNLTNLDLKIVNAAVEDLLDPVTGKAIDDRLMLTLKNTGSTELSNFEVFYQMTDVTTGATESYYQKLDGFSLAAGSQDYVYFDNKTDPGHYPENQFSLFRSSQNQVDFQITVSSDGAAIATATATKAVGTGEKVD